jgi:hypothetical protein
VVENRSGADWDGVRLSLVSGNPAAFRQPLYAPILVQRPELPVRVAEQVAVRPDTGARPPPPATPPPAAAAMRAPSPAPRAAGPAAAPEQEMAAAISAAPVAAVPQAAVAASAGRVAFTLPAPATVRDGETANLPFLDAALPAERVWWVQDLSARSPLSAVRLRNTTGQVLRTASPPSTAPGVAGRRPAPISATRRSAPWRRARRGCWPSRATGT